MTTYEQRKICNTKRFFATAEDAQKVSGARGRKIYKCEVCKGWHTKRGTK